MATIAENLQTLQDAKTAIKTAIENKGQDLTDVPFTEYAGKIEAIESVDKSAVVKKIIEARGGSASYLFEAKKVNPALTQKFIEEAIQYDTFENATALDRAFWYATSITKYPKMNTRNVQDLQYTFYANISLAEPPDIDTSSSKNLYYTFFTCVELPYLPLYDTRNVEFMGSCCQDCRKLESIAGWDLRNCYSFHSSFNLCYALKEIWIKNIKASLQVGSGTSWGHLLTQESALHLCKECRTTDTAHTITFATPVYDALEPLYVKLIDITDEMRAEDDLIDEKLPFEVCESTDEGAMTMASYMASKNWSIAK